MNYKDVLYGEKRFLRVFEKLISRLEGLLNRLVSDRFNPLYHLGSLAIFLLFVLAATGVYLTIFYRPGTEVAYPSVENISSNWFGLVMRGVHRYASDAFMLVILLHGLKMLAAGRFWGSRWLAWVSGLVMVGLTWFIGVLGFWLVWDQRAQWITEALIELMKGPVAITFLATDITSSTFSAFVMALFLHIFIPLGFAILIFVHVLRLARTRLVSPRWMMLFSAAGFILLSFLYPVRSAGPVNMDRVVEAVKLDLWYLGFLALLDRFGSLPVFLTGGLVIVLLFLLPWIARGKHLGPAVVTDSRCTGCSLCSLECPYHAIEMLPREAGDSSGYKRRAQVLANLCTGCGICVGTCASAGIELQNLPTRSVYQEGLLVRVQKQRAAGVQPVVLFTCQRQAAAGGVAQFLANPDTPRVGEISCILPCVGMVDPGWTKELFAAGVREIAFLSCPYDDCSNREGPHWLNARFSRRKGLLRPGLHWIEIAPGDHRPLANLLTKINEGSCPSEPPVLPDTKAREKIWPRLPAAALVFLLLGLLALPLDLAASRMVAGQGQVRIVIEHHGIIKTEMLDSGMKLPEHASVDPAQILGGERYPVQLQVWVDGQLMLNDSYMPTGLRKEGKINGLGSLTLPAGNHTLEVKMKDDGGNWRVLFHEMVNIQSTTITTLFYDSARDRFKLD